jgi:hypothetical protein
MIRVVGQETGIKSHASAEVRISDRGLSLGLALVSVIMSSSNPWIRTNLRAGRTGLFAYDYFLVKLVFPGDCMVT